MARTVTVNEGYNNIALPDGRIYNEGDTATLTDEQYARIGSRMFTDILTEGDYQSDIILVSPSGTRFRLVVDDNGDTATEEVED